MQYFNDKQPVHCKQQQLFCNLFKSFFLYFIFIYIFAAAKRINCFKPFIAQMAKLVDALVSGTSVSNDVQVRVLFWAQKTVQRRNGSTA
jgi:hypothetical protein